MTDTTTEATKQEPPAFYVAVTGHRPNKLGGYKVPNPLYDLVMVGLYQAFLELKPTYVITGMAIGLDQWAAELCINMNIPFVAAIPFDGQDAIWPPYAKTKYHWLLSQAAYRYTICEGGYEPWKMQKRNEWMINSCHQVVAAFDGTPGGTANCLTYAITNGKPVRYIPLPPAGVAVGDFFNSFYGAMTQKQPEALQPLLGKRVVEL